MASDFKRAVANRNSGIDAATAKLNSGRIEIRTTPVPAGVGDASTGTLLGTCNHAATAFQPAAGGSATANPIASDTNADASGDAAYFRSYANGAGDTAAEWQGLAGDATDAPVDMQFDNKSIVLGGTIAITSMTYSEPE